MLLKIKLSNNEELINRLNSKIKEIQTTFLEFKS